MKKKVLAIFFSLCLCFSLTITATAANISAPINMGEQIVVPKNATLEIIDGKEVYSDFTDSNGNYYDYYCPENGAYFRWTDSNEGISPAVNTYTQIRNFEFEFDYVGLIGPSFEINYTGGYFIARSYLYNHYYEEEIDTPNSYEFTIKLKQRKTFSTPTIATLETATNSEDAVFYTCTNGGTYFFELDLVDSLPNNNSTTIHFVKGTGTIYGTTVL